MNVKTPTLHYDLQHAPAFQFRYKHKILKTHQTILLCTNNFTIPPLLAGLRTAASRFQWHLLFTRSSLVMSWHFSGFCGIN